MIDYKHKMYHGSIMMKVFVPILPMWFLFIYIFGYALIVEHDFSVPPVVGFLFFTPLLVYLISLYYYSAKFVDNQIIIRELFKKKTVIDIRYVKTKIELQRHRSFRTYRYNLMLKGKGSKEYIIKFVSRQLVEYLQKQRYVIADDKKVTKWHMI